MAENKQTMPQPTAVLGQYKGFAVVRHCRPVTEKSIDAALRQLRTRAARFLPTDAPAMRGDRVKLDSEGFSDGEPIPASRMENVETVLGTGKLMPEAEAGICGHKAGERFALPFTYPENFRVPELSGQSVSFHITLHSVARKTVPELNEAFIREQGCETLAQLRETLRREKEQLHLRSADKKAKDALVAMAGAALDAQIPPALLGRMAQQELHNLEVTLRKSGIRVEDYLKNTHHTAESLEHTFYKAAEARVRARLAVQCIAEAEKLDASPDEIEAEYRRLALLHETDEGEVRRALTPEAVRQALIAEKVEQLLLDSADVTTVVDETPAILTHRKPE